MSIKDLEKIWDEFDNNYKDEEKINPSVLQGTNDLEWEYINVCKNCSGDISDNKICYQCGFSLREQSIEFYNAFETCIPVTLAKSSFKSKINKMQEWYMWSNSEKNEHKLKICVQNL